MQKGTLFVTGASGYIGLNLVKQAVTDGWRVKGLVRSQKSADRVVRAGGHPVQGDATVPESWISEVEGATAFVDLAQPKFPKRMSPKNLTFIADFRFSAAQNTIEAMVRIPRSERPAYFFISGADDLQPDGAGRISHSSQLREKHFATSNIGIPIRQYLERSQIQATYIHFGSLVYGPGKGFANQIVPGLVAGRLPVIGSGANKLPVVHVLDAVRAVSHVAALPVSERLEKTFLVTDGSDFSQEDFLRSAAALIDAPRPKSVPAWVVALMIGKPLTDLMKLDVSTDNSALLKSGFSFLYPSPGDGFPPTLLALGYRLAA